MSDIDVRFEEIKRRIKCGACEVIGIGRSNYPLIDMLIKINAKKITVRDGNAASLDREKQAHYTALGVDFRLGENYLDGLCGGDEKNTVIFRTPAIRPDKKEFSDAVGHGAILSSEMELFLMLTPTVSFGITGSDGKTTTTTLIYKFLSGDYRVFVGGNIGTPLLPELDVMTKDDFSVLELSSFQLMNISVSPDVAVITNISPNHLNWHIDMAEYTEAKMRIFSKEQGCRRLVINADCKALVSAVESKAPDIEIFAFSSSKHSFSEVSASTVLDVSAAIYINDNGVIVFDNGKNCVPVLPTDVVKLPGRHNLENYMAAIGATYGYVNNDIIIKTASEFGGVEHRLEFVRELDGVKYYNSSIDSSPTRTAAALSALNKKPIIICGGSDKHIPFAPLAESLCKMAKAVVLTGEAGPKIKAALLDCDLLADSGLILIENPSFEGAVKAARSLAGNGDIVLLSPACASFDAFKNFEERGKTFKNIVNGF